MASLARSRAVFLLMAYLLSSAAPVGAMGSKKGLPTGEIGESYVWYDGDRERSVWMNSGLLADFSGTGSPPDLSGFTESMTPVSSKGGMRLWKLKKGLSPAGVIEQLKKNRTGGRFSPLFHESPTSGGRKRALPGNIIVYLDPAWDRGTVEGWAAGRRLEIVRKLEVGTNVFVLKTGPGLEALETANALYQSGEVVAAFPDWWEEFASQ